MHNFLFFIFSLCTISVIGQANTQEPAYNNSSNSNNMNIAVPAEKELDSTVIFKSEEIESKSLNKKSKSATSKDLEIYQKNNLEEASSPQAADVQSYSTSFSLSKQQASTQRTQRSPSAIQQNQMNQVVVDLEKSAPESFEFHYFKYVAGNYNVELIDHLKKAEELRPSNSDVQIQMAAYYLIMNDSKNALTYLDKLVASTRLNKDVIDYAEDLIQSAPENGTLITHGFDDTYASLYVQLSKKIRSDVKLISLDFLQSEQYKKDLKAGGFVLPERTTIDVNYLNEFCSKNALKNLSISMTTPKEYLVSIQQNLFVVGLVFEYETDLTFNNFYRNDYLWNEVLVKKIVSNATNDKAKQLSSNYLPMLLHLKKVYGQRGEAAKAGEIDKTIDGIAIQCKKYEQVQKLKSSY